ncbi:hypothetical protein D3C73_1374600 [compost metagenome]
MDPRKAADVIFRETNSPFEIVRADFFLGFFFFKFVGIHFTGRKCGKQSVYFVL